MKKTLQILTLLFLLLSLALTTSLRLDLTKGPALRSPGLAAEAPKPSPLSAAPSPAPEAAPAPSPAAGDPAPEDPAPTDLTVPVFEATPSPEPVPTPSPEPTPELFTISAIGDCTLYSHQNLSPGDPASFTGMMGEDYGYPFHNTIQYFDEDELTIANLECTLSDNQLYSSSLFHFKAPASYAKILTAGGVDFVNTANNHTADFGQQGIEDTCAALEAEGVPYGTEGQAQIITTPNGIRIGIYCDYHGYYPREEDCVAAIEQLKAEGAEYIICMFHWGQDELVYRPKEVQIELAHACVDAGADFIYGSHSHCLQPYEEYDGAYILYSIGNWSFGGSTGPSDMDTAIFQIVVKRDLDGSISNESCGIIPCCVSSRPVLEGYTGFAYNDYCPTPYEPGSEFYERAMSKILGTYEGPDGNVDYSGWLTSYG